MCHFTSRQVERVSQISSSVHLPFSHQKHDRKLKVSPERTRQALRKELQTWELVQLPRAVQVTLTTFRKVEFLTNQPAEVEGGKDMGGHTNVCGSHLFYLLCLLGVISRHDLSFVF